ncbi:MAG: SEC-C domain-containing protein [Gammaproteobacteria bacterium]|nr:SEC-C domain-containing protein [Gammaproteobacteria bacterium]
MRSRFCAFKIANGSYLYETHHPDFRGNLTAEELTLSAKQSNWCKLEVVKSQLDSNSHGTVYFRAFFIKAGYLYCHTELSFFSKYEDQWMYQRGEFPGDSFTPKKLGRNEICPCDSGKKFKSCCS